MNKYDFTSLVKDPLKLGAQDAEALKMLVAEFPYFAIGRNLLVKALHNTKHYEYDKVLKQATLQAGNRSVLYNLVHDLPVETESSAMLNNMVDAKILAVQPITDKESIQVEPIIEMLPNIEVLPSDNETAPVTLPFIVEEIHEIEVTPIVPEPKFLLEQLNEITTNEIELPVEPVAVAEPINISEPAKSIIPEVNPPRLIIPEPEPEFVQQALLRPVEIEEQEKLVESTGKFVRYISKNPHPPLAKNQESLINAINDPAENILQNFDISSLEDLNISEVKNVEDDNTILSERTNQLEPSVDSINIGEIETVPLADNNFNDQISPNETVAARPLVQEKEEIVEPVIDSISIENADLHEQVITLEHLLDGENIANKQAPSSELIEEEIEDFTNNNESEIAFSEPIVNTNSSDIEQPNENEFLDWLNKKQPDENVVKTDDLNSEQVIEESKNSEVPEPVLEGSEKPVQFIYEDEAFVEAFQTKLAIATNSLLSIEIQNNLASDSDQNNLQIPAEVEDEIIEYAEPTPVGEFAAFDFFNRLKPTSSIVENELLRSLGNYEVNEFLAPVYASVNYNNQLFEDHFSEVFIPRPGIEPKAKIVLTPKHNLEPNKSGINDDENKVEHVNFPKHTEPQPKIQPNAQTTESILDKFIRESPSIARPKSEFYSPLNMAKQSAEDNSEMVSETLAQIYTRQALYKKAIAMYEKLGLLYPNKLSYFAGLINQIKSAHNIE